MTVIKRIAALFALLLNAQPATLAAQAPGEPAEAEIAIGFAPPPGTTLSYEIDQRTQRGERVRHGRLVRDYRFERHGDGYRAWAELRSVASDSPEPERSFIEAAGRPLVGIRYALLLDAAGAPLGIENQGQVWAAILDGLALIRGHYENDAGLAEPMRRAMIGMVDTLARYDEAAQGELLLREFGEPLAFANRRIARAPLAYAAELPAPWGGTIPIAGTMRIERSGDREVAVLIEAEGAAEADLETGHAEIAISETARYRIDRATGLLIEMRRERRTGAPGAPESEALVERESLRLTGGL